MNRRHVGFAMAATVAGVFATAAGLVAAPESPASASRSVKGSSVVAKRNGPSAIASGATSGIHCVGGSVISGKRALTSNVHPLGFLGSGNRVTVNFDSDFDPVAIVIGAQIGSPAPDGVAKLTYVVDDDSGGNLEPKVTFTTSYDGSYFLVVGGSDPGVTGCYTFEVVVAR